MTRTHPLLVRNGGRPQACFLMGVAQASEPQPLFAACFWAPLDYTITHPRSTPVRTFYEPIEDEL